MSHNHITFQYRTNKRGLVIIVVQKPEMGYSDVAGYLCASHQNPVNSFLSHQVFQYERVSNLFLLLCLRLRFLLQTLRG